MDHTSLDLCLRIDCLNSFFKTRKTIHAEEKDIFYSAVLQIIEHSKPELAGFIVDNAKEAKAAAKKTTKKEKAAEEKPEEA
jgi:hypothetical protein